VSGSGRSITTTRSPNRRSDLVKIIGRERSVAAPIQPFTCAAVRAPTMAPETPGQLRTHAIATAETVAP
jgi:hypothetical protein